MTRGSELSSCDLRIAGHAERLKRDGARGGDPVGIDPPGHGDAEGSVDAARASAC